jgi:hypothetical protein
MKNILIIVFLSSVRLFSQEIDYQLYLKNEYNISDFDNPIIRVPEKGKYKLISGETDEIYFVEITMNNSKDTISLPSIEMYIIAHPPSYNIDISESELKRIKLDCRPIFKNCGLPINGEKTDYFTNENVRLSGTFKNGYAIGEIREYYQNGGIKEITNYDDEGLIIGKIEYNEKGIEIEN